MMSAGPAPKTAKKMTYKFAHMRAYVRMTTESSFHFSIERRRCACQARHLQNRRRVWNPEVVSHVPKVRMTTVSQTVATDKATYG